MIVDVGLLYSTSGTYAAIAREALDGALTAIAEIEADPAFDVKLNGVVADPGGSIALYRAMSEGLLRGRGVRHVIGAITSISRKEISPLFEKHDALLWYACPYEGFEANENVIYLNACPNQHIVPLLAHLLPRYGRTVMLVGSNYIWGWEVNRIARELVLACGGAIAGERYLAFDDVDIGRLMQEIEAKQPDIVLNNLVGASSHAFLRAYAELGRRNPAFLPALRPVASCNLTECEFGVAGHAAVEGCISALPYVDTLATPENAAFRTRLAKSHGPARRASSFFVGAYSAVRMLAEAIRAAGTDAIDPVKAVLHARSFATPAGDVTIDPRTNHAALPTHLARADGAGGFEILGSSLAPIEADPYLVRFDQDAFAARVLRQDAGGRPALRVVS